MESWMIEDLERLRKEQEIPQEELVIPYHEYWYGGPEYEPDHQTDVDGGRSRWNSDHYLDWYLSSDQFKVLPA